MVGQTQNHTGMTLYNIVNGIADIVKAPGDIFTHHVIHGVAFMAIVGLLLAIGGIAIGVPNTHLQFSPGMIFGFAYR